MKSKVKMKTMHMETIKSESNEFSYPNCSTQEFHHSSSFALPALHSYSCSSLIKSSLVGVKPWKCCEQNTRFHQPYPVLFTVVCNKIGDETGITGSN
jgi:hypothetical protein